ncbi:hypothetical protein DSO57_1024105 [Entomophthora muscae]|uniref:Uncharacterized protein n=1 Tax=Entomophthora muscae TaxID=34485 RepID=A0ACC2T2J0_9FUNG|nr:hypothetical protein DSO57_1024105 [Entomophthora muscae]
MAITTGISRAPPEKCYPQPLAKHHLKSHQNTLANILARLQPTTPGKMVQLPQLVKSDILYLPSQYQASHPSQCQPVAFLPDAFLFRPFFRSYISKIMINEPPPSPAQLASFLRPVEICKHFQSEQTPL